MVHVRYHRASFIIITTLLKTRLKNKKNETNTKKISRWFFRFTAYLYGQGPTPGLRPRGGSAFRGDSRCPSSQVRCHPVQELHRTLESQEAGLGNKQTQAFWVDGFRPPQQLWKLLAEGATLGWTHSVSGECSKHDGGEALVEGAHALLPDQLPQDVAEAVGILSFGGCEANQKPDGEN